MLKCKIYFTRAVITVRHGSEVIKRKKTEFHTLPENK